MYLLLSTYFVHSTHSVLVSYLIDWKTLFCLMLFVLDRIHYHQYLLRFFFFDDRDLLYSSITQFIILFVRMQFAYLQCYNRENFFVRKMLGVVTHSLLSWRVRDTWNCVTSRCSAVYLVLKVGMLRTVRCLLMFLEKMFFKLIYQCPIWLNILVRTLAEF